MINAERLAAAPVQSDRVHRPALLGLIHDTRAMAWRNLLAFWRVPQLMVFTFIQPVIFVLLFRYVFGGAISVPGGHYVDFLMPGIFVQTVVFGATSTAIGLASDVKSGLLERFRSLPMSRAAVLAGRTLADLARNLFVVLLMASVGFMVGFRIHTSAPEFIAGLALVLVFSFVFSWVFATVGLTIADPESAQAATFPIIAALVFASAVFVPVSSMPSWLRLWAEHQPVSVTASAVRGLMIGGLHRADLFQSLGWCILIFCVCAPLAVWRYRRLV